MHLNPAMDPQLVDKIASEVKSQGVFDQFRKDSMADVDTKPAYQNLRQRVENTVKKFLSQQKWSPELNKNQLREKLRRHITDAGFLDVGVERIVDQVVNPKISSVFQPKIEDIAYKYLKIPKPVPKVEPQSQVINNFLPLPHNVILQIDTNLLPTDLEQVSPDSDKATVKSESRDDSFMDVDEKVDDEDDDESPPFEPLEGCATSPQKEGGQKDGLNSENPNTGCVSNTIETSTISDREENVLKHSEVSYVKLESTNPNKLDISDSQDIPATIEYNCDVINNSAEVTQESQLSQVSSNSRLSIVTHENSDDGDRLLVPDIKIKQENNVNISEEAQMPKFNENSNGGSADVAHKGELCDNKLPTLPLHFDIKKDEIKFEGTERKIELPVENSLSPDNKESQPMEFASRSRNLPDDFYNKSICEGFKFSKINFKCEDVSTENSNERMICNTEKSETSQCSVSQSQSKGDLRTPGDDLIKPLSQAFIVETPQTNTNSSRSDRDREKDESTRHSSTSSHRHKKHYKDKRSDKERERDRDRGKDKNRHGGGSSKKSSSSNDCLGKNTPDSSKKNTTTNNSSSSTSRHSHSHSSSKKSQQSSTLTSVQKGSLDSHSRSSSKSSHQLKSKHHSHDDRHYSRIRDSKKDKSSESKTLSKSESSKDSKKSPATTSSNQKKADDKLSVVTLVDDHYASKTKSHLRKSTDSNDDDNSKDNTALSRNGQSQNSVHSNGSEGTLSSSVQSNNKNSPPAPNKTSDSEKTYIASSESTVQTHSNESRRQNIIILDNLLENPSTNFIQLEAGSISHHIRMYCSSSDDLCISADSLHFFEENNDQFTLRLKMLQEAIENCRRINNLEASYTPSLENDSVHSTDAEFSLSPLSRQDSRSVSPRHFAGTSATLHIDCIQYDNAIEDVSDVGPINKRFKYAPPMANVSPTPSELSVNSKENECVDKNYSFIGDHIKGVVDAKLSLTEKRSSVVANKTNQRYSNEDLYKPRPILSQRSRRRDLDTVI